MLLTTFQDCEAYRLRGNEQGWDLVGSMESKGRPGAGTQRDESALNMFRQMDLKGKTKDDTQLKTVHQNTISTIREYSGGNGSVSQFSSKLKPFHSVAVNLLMCYSKRCRRASSDLEGLAASRFQLKDIFSLGSLLSNVT